MRPPLGRLHVLTDETLQTRFSHVELARLALAGGADVIQVREKRPRPARELMLLARECVELAHASAAQLLVNDHVHVALEAGADGVHLGSSDLDPAEARKVLGLRAWIGRTVNTPAEADSQVGAPVDYLGVGPVFGTHSKAAAAAPLGLGGLERIARAARRPVIAIGNITPDRVAEVLAAGAYGIAVLSSVVCQRDPAASAASLREALDECCGPCVR